MAGDKRYQVFVSSTYTDLKEERQKVFLTVMKAGCIPSGMELFPAADEEQWRFIKRIIDDCDYYLLIVGGRYGSTTPEGISYTEKEYDYAVERGLYVIALLHSNPEEIPLGKSEGTPAVRAQLEAFRAKVATGRLVNMWSKAEDLPGQVALSLLNAMTSSPAVGWVRANQATDNQTLLSELNEVRKEAERLRAAVAEYQASARVPIPDLAGLDEKVTLRGIHWLPLGGGKKWFAVDLSWREVFALIAPSLQKLPSDETTQAVLAESLSQRAQRGATFPSMDDQDFQTVRIQLSALGLVKTDYMKTTAGGMALFWSLTKAGDRLLWETRTVRTGKPDSAG